MAARLVILFDQIREAGAVMGRKLTSYRGAPAVDLSDIPEANFLPVYEAAALAAGAGNINADYLTANPLESFRVCPPENVFILSFDCGRRFLVNREGNHYARYIARLIG